MRFSSYMRMTTQIILCGRAGNFEFHGDSFAWNWQLRINLMEDEVCNKTKFKIPSFFDSVSKGLIVLTPDAIFQSNNHKVFQDQTWWPGSRVIFTLWTSRRVIKPPVFALNITLGRRMSLPLHCGKNWRCQLKEIAIYRKHFTLPSSIPMKKKITILSLTKK